MDVPPAQFFKGSPMLEVIDFLERLAPFSSPDLLVRDETPLRSADLEIAVPLAGESLVSPGDEANDEAGVEGSGRSTEEGFDAYEALRRSLGRD
jgi:nitrous oxidase accessory protein